MHLRDEQYSSKNYFNLCFSDGGGKTCGIFAFIETACMCRQAAGMLAVLCHKKCGIIEPQRKVIRVD